MKLLQSIVDSVESQVTSSIYSSLPNRGELFQSLNFFTNPQLELQATKLPLLHLRLPKYLLPDNRHLTFSSPSIYKYLHSDFQDLLPHLRDLRHDTTRHCFRRSPSACQQGSSQGIVLLRTPYLHQLYRDQLHHRYRKVRSSLCLRMYLSLLLGTYHYVTPESTTSNLISQYTGCCPLDEAPEGKMVTQGGEEVTFISEDAAVLAFLERRN